MADDFIGANDGNIVFHSEDLSEKLRSQSNWNIHNDIFISIFVFLNAWDEVATKLVFYGKIVKPRCAEGNPLLFAAEYIKN